MADKNEKKLFPDEIYVYAGAILRSRDGRTNIIGLTVSKELQALGTAKGRDVGVYKLVKKVRAVKKTQISVSVEDAK